LSFGKSAHSTGLDDMLLTAAQFLKRELPIRFAHRIVELDCLPYGLHAMPSVRRIRDWYSTSYQEIRSFPHISAGDYAVEREFTALLQSIYTRHNSAIVTLARGIFEFRESLGVAHGQVRGVSARRCGAK
jgi:pyruvate dehydrogenase kinase 2/3/4